MNASDLATTLRSAPGWMIAVVAVVTVIALIAAGPLAGLAIKRRRDAELTAILHRPGLARVNGEWIETGEIDLTSLRAEELKRDREEFRTSQERANGAAPDDVQVITDFSPTSIITKPLWAEEPTQGWEILEPAANVFDAEILEPDDDGLTEAERQFLADPLGSWLLPPLDEYDFLPTADEAVSFLLRVDLLTGAGMDIDAEWASWNLYAKEESNA